MRVTPGLKRVLVLIAERKGVPVTDLVEAIARQELPEISSELREEQRVAIALKQGALKLARELGTRWPALCREAMRKQVRQVKTVASVPHSGQKDPNWSESGTETAARPGQGFRS